MTMNPRGGDGKKPFPKTFGDVMKGIPAGKGGDSKPRDEKKPRRDDARTADAPKGPGRRPDRKQEEGRRGPVVVRKPPRLVGKPEVTPPPAASATSPDAAPGGAGPATVFRRADGVNLPPREAEGEKTLAPDAGAPVDESFAELFAASEKAGGARPRLEVGQKVSARIVKIGQDVAFLDLGGKGEGMISLSELRDSKGEIIVTAGEILEGYVLSLSGEHGGTVVTKQLSKGAQREFLFDARDSRIPVEGLVTAQNKGGLEVDLGGLRGFCPVSQIDLRFVDPADFVGKRLSFRVTEVKDRDVVLSRRALLEAEAAKRAEEARKRIHVGAQLSGTVTSLRDFGAFVDLGGLEGLLHVSELGHGRVGHPKDVLQAGQTVTVEVLRVDEPKEAEKAPRIALSMKALQEDPWVAATRTLKVGDRLSGKVVRLQPFGAFVELLPGVDGLVHVSALGAKKRVAHPKEVVSEGEELRVLIENLDVFERKISLRRLTAEDEAEGAVPGPSAEAEAPRGAPHVGDVHEVTVDKVEPFGVFVRFAGGKGLVPNAEMAVKGDIKKQMPPGTRFKAAIIEIDRQGRLRLSRVAAEKEEERSEYRQFVLKQARPQGKGFGTLGDLLKRKKD
jgi:small subunit ribosomal protein S1